MTTLEVMKNEEWMKILEDARLFIAIKRS